MHTTFLTGTYTFAISFFEVVKNFSYQLFLFPEKHMFALIVIGALPLAGVVGLAFLSKKVYEKYFPESAEE